MGAIKEHLIESLQYGCDRCGCELDMNNWYGIDMSLYCEKCYIKMVKL